MVVIETLEDKSGFFKRLWSDFRIDGVDESRTVNEISVSYARLAILKTARDMRPSTYFCRASREFFVVL